MLKLCYVLLFSTMCTYQARFIFDDSCRGQSTSSVSDYCLLKCMQIFYDSKCCSICEFDTGSWENILKTKHIALDKLRLELCLACENATHSQLYGNTITHLFETMNSSWCIDALNLNEIITINPIANCSNRGTDKFRRSKRSVRLFPSIRSDDSYSITYSDANLVMGSIFVGTILIIALIFLCKSMTDFLGSPTGYRIN